jgi:hypothetical protein
MTAAVVWSSWAYDRFKLPGRVLDLRPDCFERSSCMLPWPAWQASHSAVLPWYLHNLAILCAPIALLQSWKLQYLRGETLLVSSGDISGKMLPTGVDQPCPNGGASSSGYRHTTS